MNFHIKSKCEQLRRPASLVAVLLIILSASLLQPPPAQAESSARGLLSKLKTYCKSTTLKLNNNAKKGCDSTTFSDEAAGLTQAINMASYSCTDMSADEKTSATTGSGTDKSNCILQKAKAFVKQVADKKPKTRDEFVIRMADILNAASGGDTSKLQHLSPDAAQGASAGSSTGESADCDSLNGTCADCNNLDDNGNAPDNCVGCSKGLCHDPAADPRASCDKHACNLVEKYVNPLVNLLSVSFGLLAIISIILGGVQYASSEGDPQKTSQAKDRIAKTIFAIVAYFFLYALLQFIIPGGLFDGP